MLLKSGSLQSCTRRIRYPSLDQNLVETILLFFFSLYTSSVIEHIGNASQSAPDIKRSECLLDCHASVDVLLALW